MHAARNAEDLIMCPRYLATGPNRKAYIDVAPGCGLVETIPRGVDNHRADVEMVERVVDTEERRQPHPTGHAFPTHAQVRRPPWRRARIQRVAHEISRRTALLDLEPRAANGRGLAPHDEMQPLLRNAGQHTAVERVHGGPCRKRVATIAIVGIRPDCREVDPRGHGEIAAQLHAAIPGASSIPN